MSSGRWEFWIDVGGTFTDCFALSPDGQLRRHKLLSNGVTKGVVGEPARAGAIIDSVRTVDPPQFWRGARFRLLNNSGQAVAENAVVDFDNVKGTLRLEPPLPTKPMVGQSYELLTATEAPVLAVRYLLGLEETEKIPPVVVRLGTTRGTNALLTRRGTRTAFVTTRGFGDILHIGYQNRPKLFELNIRKPTPLFSAVVEIDERVATTGEVIIAPHPVAIRQQLTALRSQNIESLAVCLLHGYEHAAHEKLVGQIAREVGFEEISLSHEIAPQEKIVARGDTTVLDAYLNPVLRSYVQSLRAAMPQCDLRIVTSAGGLVSADRFSGKDSILSGPAAGVVGFSRVAKAAGFTRAIGFDMGGTSTDVSRFDGRHEMEYEIEKAGVRVVAPMLAIETVAAGGGSICRFDGMKLVVGPESAGADPGPACYGRGGPLAVTDLNFFLGKILPVRFPFPLDRTAAEHRLAALAEQVTAATGVKYTLIELAEGLLKIANANMVQAIRTISIAKGCDPREYVLVPFGGAAGQHACAVAKELGIAQILHHPDAGLLSAYGIGLADNARHRAAVVHQPYLQKAVSDLDSVFRRLELEARAELQQDFPDSSLSDVVDVRRRLDLRYRGLDAYLTIDEPADHNYAAAYEGEHRKLFGYTQSGKPLEIVAARVEVLRRSSQKLPVSKCELPPDDAAEPSVERIITTYFGGQPFDTKVFTRAGLKPGNSIIGPAIVYEVASTTVIDPGWHGEVLSDGTILAKFLPSPLHQLTPSPSPVHSDREKLHSEFVSPDPIQLEIFNNHFAAIAEQMGITLRNTASSVNVKERLDFSCAIFTPRGELVANAPHIPVHLGAMSETVRSVLADNPQMAAGDMFVTNDPYRGGSHLPDVTVVTPVFGNDVKSGEAERILFFTASRAHHAEIGGITPGSMPPFSRTLAEEGELIRKFKLIETGQERFDQLRNLLLAGPHPSRAVDDNLADVQAQVAANMQGERDLLTLVERFTLPMVEAYMGHIQSAAERKLRAAIRKLPPGRREFTDHLDDGTPIHVALTIHPPFPAPHSALPALTIDFTGTGPVHTGNLNANRAIVTAAVMYVLRLLIDEDIPLNEGVLAPVELILPQGLLNPPPHDLPEKCAAMVCGNVETSQRVVDVLLGALGLAAASQGTMNNLLFGDATFGYYETICGGAGATATVSGADAVHTHMTNTRLTDPEVMERRYPVRMRQFCIRRGSGGAGQNRGGDGVMRQVEFLRPLEVSILSQRRGLYPPYGMYGGSPGRWAAMCSGVLTAKSKSCRHSYISRSHWEMY